MTPSCSRPVSSRPRWRAKSTRSRAAARTLIGPARDLERRCRSAPLRRAGARPAGTPSSASSSWICMDSAGCVTAQASAALPKCRWCGQRRQITQLLQCDHADKIFLSRAQAIELDLSGRRVLSYQCAARDRHVRARKAPTERNMDAKTDDKSAGKCPFTGAADTGTATGGRTRWTSRCSIGTPRCPIRWARISTTPRSSRLSTSTP